MIWKGNELNTIGDLMDKGINACNNPAEAHEFMKHYRAENPHADENIGYLSGYFSLAEMIRIQSWFNVDHPVFGRIDPSPEEAFDAGMRMAEGK